jgi:hypothetical protein
VSTGLAGSDRTRRTTRPSVAQPGASPPAT